MPSVSALLPEASKDNESSRYIVIVASRMMFASDLWETESAYFVCASVQAGCCMQGGRK